MGGQAGVSEGVARPHLWRAVKEQGGVLGKGGMAPPWSLHVTADLAEKSEAIASALFVGIGDFWGWCAIKFVSLSQDTACLPKSCLLYSKS